MMIEELLSKIEFPIKTSEIYFPNQDSYLFLDYITQDEFDIYRMEEFLHGISKIKKKTIKILDMGCSTGILGFLLLIRLIELINVERKLAYSDFSLDFIDINPQAIEYCKKFIALNKKLMLPYELNPSFSKRIDFNYYVSDLFDTIPENTNSDPYDFIIFNPPYLPSELEIIKGSTKKNIDFAWDGGDDTGNKTILRFFKQLQDKIHKSTQIYFISSSHADVKQLIEQLERNYQVFLLQSTHIFFEDLLLFMAKIK